MNILLLGSGGREHAIAWKIAQSPKVDQLFIAPGNAGTALVGTNVNIKADDFSAIKEFALANHIGMVVVGPEDPLVKGVYDYFKNDVALAGIPVIGPSKEGAQLEGSKDFAKAFMMRHNIPTARYKSISAGNLEEGYAFLEELQAPYVLKADRLAGIAEHTPQHIVQLLLCFFERVENQHTFTGSQTVGLQYVGSLQFFQESVSFF